MRFVLIGGGDLGEKCGSALSVDEEVIAFCGRERRSVLFVPTAQEDNQGYCDAFLRVYERLGCKVKFLKLYNDKLSANEIDDLVFGSDIIYVGGGSVTGMLKKWREKNIIGKFRAVAEQNVLLSGVSAGAMCWCSYCISDSSPEGETSRSFSEVGCPGFLDLNLCPHFNEVGRRDFTVELSKKTGRTYYGVSNNAAIFVDNMKISFFRTNNLANAYKVTPEGEVDILINT
ncbi:MAG: Type 1 glutamine amidotransferase-like domain-containing protein [Rickettsiales bacterium]|jgi:dipeptidase E|nr:Type 1 glutamine amidotransferase-like domain-containing protein [Rickettsiales bacterium]